MTSDLISCIIPVYNGERYVAEAIDSVVAQTYRPLQIIVIDDGSTDRTADEVAQYREYVTYIFQTNAGPAAARNGGLSVAKGEFVAFLDADDLWHWEKLARQMACFEANPDLEICLTHVRDFWSPELPVKQVQDQDSTLMNSWPGNICQTLLARRKVFAKVGLFNPAMGVGEDDDWFIRAADRGVAREMLADVLVYRRLYYHNSAHHTTEANDNALVTRAT